VISMLAGLLLKLGYLNFVLAYLTLMAADLIGDTGWYCVGYFGGEPFVKRFGKYFNISETEIAIISRLFHKHQDMILFVSKLTMGLGFPFITLTTAGMSKINFKRYILINFGGQLIYTGVLIAIGYFFGNLYISIGGIMGKVALAAIFVVIFILLLRFRRYIRNKTIKESSI